MDMLPVVVTLLSLIGTSLSAPSVTISTDSTDPHLTSGDVVTITCSSTETGPLDSVRLRAQSPSGLVTVMTNTRVEDDYRGRKRPDGSDRYINPVYNYRADDRAVDMMVTINGIQAEDSGRFNCELQADEGGISETISLAVKVPVTSVSMGTIRPNGTVQRVADDSEITLSHGTQGGLACIVRLDSYVITPVVNVTVDGVPAPVNFVVGLARLAEGTTAAYEYTYTYTTSEPDYNLHESVVRCTAYAPGFEYDKQSAQVNVMATFLPVITCVDTKPMAAKGDNGVITCHIISNPNVSTVEVNFGFDVKDRSYIFTRGRQTFQNKYVLERQDDGNNVTITFTIMGMTDALLDDYVYQIQAESALGVTISPDIRFKRDTVSGSTKTLSSWILLTVITLAGMSQSIFTQ